MVKIAGEPIVHVLYANVYLKHLIHFEYPEFYILTKIHKPTITGRPIIFGCDGPTERISSFVDSLQQPISKIQKSFLKDTTDFINSIENTEVKKRTFLVLMDVTSLYTNIPQNEGIEIVCKAYELKTTLLFLHIT